MHLAANLHVSAEKLKIVYLYKKTHIINAENLLERKETTNKWKKFSS